MLNFVVMGNRKLSIDVVEMLRACPDIRLTVVLNPSDLGDSEGLPSLKNYLRDFPEISQLQPMSLKGGEVQAAFTALQPDVIISCSYERLIPESLFRMPRIGCFNIHFAMLPLNRGCLPVVWAMCKGDPVGVTLHRVDAGVDCGETVRQEQVRFEETETCEQVYNRCVQVGGQMFREFLSDNLAGITPSSTAQIHAEASYQTMKHPFDRWIPWHLAARDVARIVNALTYRPHPSGRSLMQGREVAIFGPAKPLQDIISSIGEVTLFQDRLRVGCGEGVIEISDIVENGKSVKRESIMQTLISPQSEEKI